MNDVLVGRNPVREALRSGRPINKIYISSQLSGAQAGEIRALAKERGVPVQAVQRKSLDRLAEGKNHQGMIACVAVKQYVEVEDLLPGDEGGDPPLLVILDEVNDPRNFGAVLRTADAAGVNGVIIPRRRSASLTPAVARTSAGAVEYVPVARTANTGRAIDYLKGQGLWIAGLDITGEKLYWDVDFSVPLAVVVGGEDKGLGRLTRQKCDFLVQLPMKGRVGSLNASVAAALLLYEVLRQRRRD